MSHPSRHTLFDTLEPTFNAVRQDCLVCVNSEKRWSRWSYRRLARLHGRPEDWASGGYLRNQMTGYASREKMLERWGIMWTADMDDHEAILFTCCPELGMEWARAQKASVIEGIGKYFALLAEYGEEKRPSRKAWFRQFGSNAGKLLHSVDRLRALADHSVFAITKGDAA